LQIGALPNGQFKPEIRVESINIRVVPDAKGHVLTGQYLFWHTGIHLVS